MYMYIHTYCVSTLPGITETLNVRRDYETVGSPQDARASPWLAARVL